MAEPFAGSRALRAEGRGRAESWQAIAQTMVLAHGLLTTASAREAAPRPYPAQRVIHRLPAVVLSKEPTGVVPSVRDRDGRG